MKKYSTCNAIGRTLCLMACLAAMVSAEAQRVDDSSRVVDLDGVVVVSQSKDLQLLRQQPLSSTLFGADELQQLNVQSLPQLSDYVPSFAMPNYGSRYTSSMYVRGIGSRVNSPAVGLYVDNIPIVSKAMLNFHLYEIDRVDFLRGPQGTLYGQNTEGGLIRLFSRQPFAHEGTDLNISFGSGLQRKAEVAHYGRADEHLAFSVAASYQGMEGFFENTTTADPADNSNEAGARARMQWQPSAAFQLDLLADYQYTSQNAFPYGEMTADETLSPYANRPGHYRRHMLTTGLTMRYALESVVFGSTTSWQHLQDDMLMDLDYRPQDFMHMEQAQWQSAITQEFTVRSNSTGLWRWTSGVFYSYQALETDAPVYFDTAMNNYLSQTIEDYAYYGMLNAMCRRMDTAAAIALIEQSGGCHIRMDMATVPGLFRTPSHNLAFFHQSELDLTPSLTATLGLRYDLSHVSLDYNTTGTVTLDESVMGTDVNATLRSHLAHEESTSFGQWLPKVGLTYRLGSSGSNLYALASKGYRAGGYNIQMFSDILQAELQGTVQSARADMEIEHSLEDYDNIRRTIEYEPEESWNYELGAHLNLFGSRVQMDLAAYYMQIHSQQLSVMASNYGFGRMMVNAGRSYSCGVELSLRGNALDSHLRWGFNYGYTRAVFTEYIDSITLAGTTTEVDYQGMRVPFVPEHTLSAHADYRIDFQGSLLHSLTLGANLSLLGKVYWDTQNLYSQEAYLLLGAHAEADLGRMTLSLWVRNLTNANYNTFATESRMAGQTLYFAQRGLPIHAGFDLRVRL